MIGRAVVAFAGIARPEKFFATLRRIGAQIVATRDFADHHPYTPREIEALIEEAGAARRAPGDDREGPASASPPGRPAQSSTLPVTLRFEEPASSGRMLRQAVAG